MFVVLLIGSVSALEFDNLKKYDTETRTITVENAFGLGKVLVKIQLISKPHEYVIRGEDRLSAQLDLWNFERDYGVALQDMEWFDEARGGGQVDKEFTYKYLKVLRVHDDVKRHPTCYEVKSSNGSMSTFCNGYTEVVTPVEITEWVEFSSISELPEGKVRVGIFTDIGAGDSWEWTPTFFGVRIPEWAVVSDALKIGLLLHYDFEGANNLSDKVVGEFNMSEINSPHVAADIGIQGSGANLTDGFYNLTGSVGSQMLNTSSTTNFWVEATIIAGPSTLNFFATDEKANNFTLFGAANGRFNALGVLEGQPADQFGNSSELVGRFAMITILSNTTANYVFVNGTQVANGSTALDNQISAMRWGAGRDYNLQKTGVYDEISFWNRSLSNEEILELYNDGEGLVFSLDFGIEVTLELPPTAFTTINTSVSFNGTAASTGSETLNLTNMTLFVYNESGSIINDSETATLSGSLTDNEVLSINNLPLGTNSWNMFACGINTSGGALCAFAPTNFTIERQNFQTTAQDWVESVFDTSNQTFLINISLDSAAEMFSATLNYNGTAHIAEFRDLGGGDFAIKRSIDIPGVDADTTKNFNWSFTFDLGVGFDQDQTNVSTQGVNFTNFTDVGDFVTLNFTIFDEDTVTAISSEFSGTFEWFLGQGTEIKNNSFIQTAAHEFDFYTIPTNQTFFVGATLDLANNTINTTFGRRIFQFGRLEISNITTEIQLLLPNATSTTNVLVQVRDQGLRPVEGVFVRIFRFYPGEGIYRIVENRRTDVFGKFVAKLIENDVIYRFEVRDINGVLLKDTNDVSIACQTAICEFNINIEDIEDDFARFENITGYIRKLTFNNVTNEFRFTWEDTTGDPATQRLEVLRRQLNGTTVVCNITSTATVGELTCAVGTRRASYQAQGFRSASDEVRRIILSIVVGDITGTFGLEGFLWAFFLLFTVVAVGAFNPAVAIALFMVTYLSLGLMGIIAFSPPIFIGILAIGGIFIWAINI